MLLIRHGFGIQSAYTFKNKTYLKYNFWWKSIFIFNVYSNNKIILTSRYSCMADTKIED